MTKTDLTAANPALQFELVNISVRLYRAHHQLLERAVALRQAKDPDFTQSDYVRETLAIQAALDLGVDVPAMPEIVRGRGGSLVERAAAKLGMSRADFEASAIRAMAAQVHGADALAEPAPRSTRAPSGTYKRGSSVRPESLGPRKRAG